MFGSQSKLWGNSACNHHQSLAAQEPNQILISPSDLSVFVSPRGGRSSSVAVLGNKSDIPCRTAINSIKERCVHNPQGFNESSALQKSSLRNPRKETHRRAVAGGRIRALQVGFQFTPAPAQSKSVFIHRAGSGVKRHPSKIRPDNPNP